MDDTKAPETKIERFENIETIMPHLQRKAEQLLSRPGLIQRHQYFQYCRDAVALARTEKDVSER